MKIGVTENISLLEKKRKKKEEQLFRVTEQG
jgi:hypothetical protein